MTTLTPKAVKGHQNTAAGPPVFRKKLAYLSLADGDAKDHTVFKKGQKVYVTDSELGWMTATVIDHQDEHLHVCTEDNQERVVAARDVVLRPPECHYTDVGDLTTISPLSAPAVLECLTERYSNEEIYTWAGQALVALNPFREHPCLYGPESITRHHEQRLHETKGLPHVYSVAADAYANMRCSSRPPKQSIIVSGESGAGKTVSARHLMKYLVTVANQDNVSDCVGTEVERRILDSNPILEAFGNAGTLRNHNSSRFGKYIGLQFDRCGAVTGGNIQTYLLEKTRVVQQPPGEHNFHIFYQVMAGLDADRKAALGLDSQMVSVHQRSTEDDRSRWAATQAALEEVGVSSSLQLHVLQVLSAVLHLRQVALVEDEEDEDICCVDRVDRRSVYSTEKTCQLLGIHVDDIETAFTHRQITASHSRRKSVFSKPCTLPEAVSRRDCLTKLLYNQLFEWLVAVINQSIHTDKGFTSIGLLDIYGFESFAANSLEQLCINYANERLQQHYVCHFLRELQEEYTLEAIPWSTITFTDNRPCLDLLEGVAGGLPGLFSLLNEECQVNRPGGDEGLRDRLLGALSGGSTLPATPKNGHSPPGQLGTPRQNRLDHPSFVVTHYAAPVTYTVQGLLDKNKDNVPCELLDLLMKSESEFVAGLFEDFEPDQPGKKKKTVLAKFKSSLDQLMAALEQTEPHYIRCIKPNSRSAPGELDRPYILEQLEASGVVETVDINRKAYPTRMPYEDFLRCYSLVLRGDTVNQVNDAQVSNEEDKENELVFDPLDVLYRRQLKLTPRRKSATPKRRLRRRAGLSSCDHTRKLCASILCLAFGRQFSQNATAICQFGKTKLFLKDGRLEHLENLRLQLLSQHAFTIQCAWRRALQRVRQKQHLAATTIQTAWRGFIQREKYLSQKMAVVTLQRAARVWLAVRRLRQEAAARLLEVEDEDETLQLKLQFDEYTSEDDDDVTEREYYTARTGPESPPGPETTLVTEDFGGILGASTSDCSNTPNPNLSTPKNQAIPTDGSYVLYTSPRGPRGYLSPVADPAVQGALLGGQAENYTVCRERMEDGGTTYHLVPSPRRTSRSRPATEAFRTVAAAISAAFLTQHRFTLAGAFTGIPYFEAKAGILSRRRMPRVQIKFHTRANPLLKCGHYISQHEFQCSLTDCLADEI